MMKQTKRYTKRSIGYVLAAILLAAGALLLFITTEGEEKDVSVLASTVVSTGDFRLTADNRWDVTNKKNYAELHWDTIDDVSNEGYKLYQSEDGTTWNIRSTNYGKAIKVLNVYPDLAASNTLKTWMDGLGLQDNDGNNLIQVTPIASAAFNANPDGYLKDASGNYQYDVIMFGTWDGNGSADLNTASYAATRAFSDAGGGILFGHDTVYQSKAYFSKFAADLGIILTAVYDGTGSTQVQVTNNGYLMKYPFELSNNQILTIPLAHTQDFFKYSDADIWLKFINSSTGSAASDDGVTLNNAYLITSKVSPNLAFIQTGHSSGQSTEDERMIIANTLYNLAQLTSDTYANDQTVKDDQAPVMDSPAIRCGKKGSLNIKLSAADVGKKYQWYIEATSKANGIVTSDVVSEEIISNVAGYFYEVTDSSSSTLQATVEGYKDEYERIPESAYDLYVAPHDDTLVYDTEAAFTLNEARTTGRYLHVVAVDRANNVSVVSSSELSEILQYVDFEVERTGDEAKLVDLALDASLDGTKQSLEIQLPLNAVIKDFASLSLPSGWYAFENSPTAAYRSFTFAIENANDLATIQTFLEALRFSLGSPVNQAGSIKLIFHEKVYTSWVDSSGVTHYYTYIDEGQSWFQSYNDAKEMTYKGLTGYLATLTSEEEHDFMYDNIAKSPGWLGGTRATLTTGGKLTDASSIPEDANAYTITGDEWYWANGPEVGQLFYKGITKAAGSSVGSAYQAWNTNEPNNTWRDMSAEYALQFAHKNSKYWNDLPGSISWDEDYNHGYYVEFSVYGTQEEGTELSDVCWSADIPQKLSLKAYDEDGQALPEGDQLFDQALRIASPITVTPVTIGMHDFIKAVNLDDSTHSLTYSVSNEYQEGKLIYANRTVTLHIRQVIREKNNHLLAPTEGYGTFISQTTGGEAVQEFPISMISSESSTIAYSDYYLRYQVTEPIYTYQPILPAYYQLTGYVLTHTNQQHLPENSTEAPIAVDVSQQPEFWLTIYIEQAFETPALYSWDYKENDVGIITVQ